MPHHGVAHLVAGRWEVDPSEEIPDAGLGWAGASRQQDVKVMHKFLQNRGCEEFSDAPLGECWSP